jgi:tetratricopeptide (TPR) repeat protein
MKLRIKAILILLLLSSASSFAQNEAELTNLIKAQYLMQKGMYETAIPYLDSALADGEDRIMVYEMRGICNLYSEQFIAAEKDFSILIDLDTNNADAYNNRALARVNLGKSYDALYDASVAIDLDPNFTEAYVNRGSILREMGDFDQSLSDFESAILLDSTNPSIHYFLGEMYEAQEELKKAAKSYQSALDYGLYNTKINYMLANLQFKLEQFEDALKNYNIVLEQNPDDIEARNNRAVTYDRLGRLMEAEADRTYLEEKMAELYPPHDSINYQLFKPTNNEISIELPDTWTLYEAIDSNMTDLIISKEDVQAQQGYFKEGVRITVNKNMEKLSGIKHKDGLITLWKDNSEKSQDKYYQYKLYSEKTFPRFPYKFVQYHTAVQYTADSPMLSMYELIAAKDDVLVVAVFQCGVGQFNYYKEIYDRAIKSLVLP